MHKAHHSVLPNNLQNMFKLYVSTHFTRQRDTFRSHRVRTNIKSVCISVCGVKLWHLLQTSLAAETCNHLKIPIRKLYLLSIYVVLIIY